MCLMRLLEMHSVSGHQIQRDEKVMPNINASHKIMPNINPFHKYTLFLVFIIRRYGNDYIISWIRVSTINKMLWLKTVDTSHACLQDIILMSK